MPHTLESWLDFNLNPKYSTDILDILWAIVQRLGLEKYHEPGEDVDFDFLGTGNFAEVYWLDDRTKVLKVTKDKADANASQLLLKKPNKYLLKVYDVFQIKYGSKKLYCIVSEKLSPLSSSTEDDFQRFYALMEHWFDVSLSFPTLKQLEEAEQVDTWERWMKTYKLTDFYLDLFKNWAKALDERHIRWGDYKADNIMMRRHLPVISDLGWSKVPSQRIPILKVETDQYLKGV